MTTVVLKDILTKAAREDMPQFEANIKKMMSEKDLFLGIKVSTVKFKTTTLLDKCKNKNTNMVEARLKELGADFIKCTRTSARITLHFRDDIHRVAFLWKFGHPNYNFKAGEQND